MNRYITIDKDNIVISIRYGSTIIEGEIQSDIGELGQVKQVDGSFITPTPTDTPQPYQPSNAEVAQMISDLQADLEIAGVIA